MKLPIHLSTIGAVALLLIATPRIYAADGDNTSDKKEDAGDKKPDDKKADDDKK